MNERQTRRPMSSAEIKISLVARTTMAGAIILLSSLVSRLESTPDAQPTPTPTQAPTPEVMTIPTSSPEVVLPGYPAGIDGRKRFVVVYAKTPTVTP